MEYRHTECEPSTSSGITSQGQANDEIPNACFSLDQRAENATQLQGIKRSNSLEENDTNERSTAKRTKGETKPQKSSYMKPHIYKCERCPCDKMCVDCKIVFCIKCIEAHNKQEGNENHTVVDIGR